MFLAFALNFILLFYKVPPLVFLRVSDKQIKLFLCYFIAVSCLEGRSNNASLSQAGLSSTFFCSLQVSDSPPEGEEMEGSGLSEGSGLFEGSGFFEGSGEEAEGSGMNEGDEDEEEVAIYFYLEESTGYMQPTLTFVAALHTVISFICIIGYNCLKV